MRCSDLCLLTDFLLFHVLVPGLLQRSGFVLRRGFFFLLNSFVPRSGSRASPTGSLLFGAAIPMVFTLTFFCFPRKISLCLPLTFFCLNRSLKPDAFCLANIFHCISMPSSGFAYAVSLFLALKMAFWSRFVAKCRLAEPQGVGFSAIQSWKVVIHAGRSPQLQWSCRKTTKTRKRAVYTLAMRTFAGLCKGTWQTFLQGRGL